MPIECETEEGDWVACPLFLGEGLQPWIVQIEEFFAQFPIPTEQHVNLASHHLVGAASTWVLSNEDNIASWNWSQFIAALREEFDPTYVEESISNDTAHVIDIVSDKRAEIMETKLVETNNETVIFQGQIFKKNKSRDDVLIEVQSFYEGASDTLDAWEDHFTNSFVDLVNETSLSSVTYINEPDNPSLERRTNHLATSITKRFTNADYINVVQDVSTDINSGFKVQSILVSEVFKKMICPSSLFDGAARISLRGSNVADSIDHFLFHVYAIHDKNQMSESDTQSDRSLVAFDTIIVEKSVQDVTKLPSKDIIVPFEEGLHQPYLITKSGSPLTLVVQSWINRNRYALVVVSNIFTDMCSLKQLGNMTCSFKTYAINLLLAIDMCGKTYKQHLSMENSVHYFDHRTTHKLLCRLNDHFLGCPFLRQVTVPVQLIGRVSDCSSAMLLPAGGVPEVQYALVA